MNESCLSPPEPRKLLTSRGANEGIGFTFLSDGRWKGDFSSLAKLSNLGQPGGDRRVVGIGVAAKLAFESVYSCAQ